MSIFFRGITETFPTLFRGIVSERNSVASLTRNRSRHNLCYLKGFSRRTHTSVMHLAPSMILPVLIVMQRLCTSCTRVSSAVHAGATSTLCCICSGSPNGSMLTFPVWEQEDQWTILFSYSSLGLALPVIFKVYIWKTAKGCQKYENYIVKRVEG